MKALLVNTAELRSQRFDLLCERLEGDVAETIRNPSALILGHLMCWHLRWAGDDAMDSGLLWDVSERRMGIWAEWPKPLVFGRALVEAGYCAPVENVYKEKELLQGRKGFVVLAGDGEPALERSWDWHKRLAKSAELIYFLREDRRKRQVASWLQTGRQVYVNGYNKEWAQKWLGLAATSAAGPCRETSGNLPEDPPQTAAQGFPPPRDVKRLTKEINQRNGERTNNQGTGNPKSRQMLTTARTHKYDNPLLVLRTFDSTENAVKLWRRTVSHNLSAVQQFLAEMTETDDTWAAIEKPAAVAVRKCQAILRGTKS